MKRKSRSGKEEMGCQSLRCCQSSQSVVSQSVSQSLSHGVHVSHAVQFKTQTSTSCAGVEVEMWAVSRRQG